MDNPLRVSSGQYLFGDLAVQMNGSPGRLFYASKEFANGIAANLRVSDVSRTGTNAGTEIPIVRDSDFQTGTIVLLGVPIDSRYRNRLRIYSTEPGADVFVRVMVGTAGTNLAMRPGRDLFDPGYAEFTAFPSKTSNGSATTAVTVDSLTPNARLWAFISVTNNDTQQITIISP